ncbi:MAG: nicotinamide-nucleotide amidohydrolase family protein [Bifidobacteriaceae bacterium]|jgi:nicotinamide-nucleotide amidase|nr:nicotinamide-nucleotide amidohydrolase family protein [Bifidobacteriaceae bacterium]
MASKRQKDTEPSDSQRAAVIVGLLKAHGLRISTAESLTGGLVAAAFVSVPGASDVFDGAVVAYTHELKSRLLGVNAEWLATHGAINSRVAEDMATGARQLFGSAVAIGTTGVAGPASADGVLPGTAYIAVSIAGQDIAVRAVRLKGGRSRVRGRVVARALELCEAALRQIPVPGEGYDEVGRFA